MPTTAAAAPREYVALMVTNHNGPTIAVRARAGRAAGVLARRFDLDEAALEPTVLAYVFRSMSVAELTDALHDPSRRRRARAELTRRGL